MSSIGRTYMWLMGPSRIVRLARLFGYSYLITTISFDVQKITSFAGFHLLGWNFSAPFSFLIKILPFTTSLFFFYNILPFSIGWLSGSVGRW